MLWNRYICDTKKNKMQLLKRVIKQFVFGSFQDKKLYLNALRWSIVIRFSMLFLPFKYYRHLLGRMQVTSSPEFSQSDIEKAKKIRAIVLSVCNNTPWESKCLVQAISCKKMLKKNGIETTLYLGVYKNPETKKLEAHAWLKMGDIVLTGRHGMEKFKIVNFYA